MIKEKRNGTEFLIATEVELKRQTMYNAGDKCPNCHRAKLQRGIKQDDKVQVYCPNCGFMAERKEERRVE